ncbi:unnamed protein product, partial [Mesorhabditis spiculigera]
MESELQSIYVYSNCTLGICFNALLIYFIATDNSGWLIDDYGFFMFSKNLAGYGKWISYMGIFSELQVYMAAFHMTLTLLAIHCIYRLKWKFLFDTPLGIFVLTVFNFTFGPLWCILCHLTFGMNPQRTALSRDELWRRFNVSIDDVGYIGPVYKWPDPVTHEMKIRWSNLLGAFGCLSILVIIHISICFGGIKLYFFVRASSVSAKTKRLNMQLLRLLFIQAAAPVIFEYTPCLMVIFGGFFGLPLSEAALYIPVFISLYATADPIFMLFTFKAFRIRFLAMLPCSYFGKQVAPSSAELSHQKTEKPGSSDADSSRH